MLVTPPQTAQTPGQDGLGLTPRRAVHRNFVATKLYEQAVRRGEGIPAQGGPLRVVTTPHTGRSPKDKFVVRDQHSSDGV